MDHAVWGIPHAGNGFLWRSGCLPSTTVDTSLNTRQEALVGLGCISVLALTLPPTLIKRGEGGLYLFVNGQ